MFIASPSHWQSLTMLTGNRYFRDISPSPVKVKMSTAQLYILIFLPPGALLWSFTAPLSVMWEQKRDSGVEEKAAFWHSLMLLSAGSYEGSVLDSLQTLFLLHAWSLGMSIVTRMDIQAGQLMFFSTFWGEEMAYWAKCLPHKHKDISSKPMSKLCVVLWTCNPSSGEAETGRFLELAGWIGGVQV